MPTPDAGWGTPKIEAREQGVNTSYTRARRELEESYKRARREIRTGSAPNLR
jgi:hypothetical protein